MTVVLPEIISEAIYTYGLFDEIVTWMALQAVKPGSVVFDVGAHFGYFSLLFAHLAGTNGKVFAFEPTPSTYQVLTRNARRVSNITALNVAAGAIPGQLEIADFGLKHSAWNTLADESRMPRDLHAVSATHIKVEVNTLDAIARAQGVMPDFIKIDAENFEHAVIGGASAVLMQNAPVILMETGSASALTAAQILAEQGYGMYVCSAPGSLTHWNGSAIDANARHKDILFVPRRRISELLTKD
jgi:FkbM family methyltransferase